MRYWAIYGDNSSFQQVRLPHHPCDAPAGGNAAYDVDRSKVVELQRIGDPAIEELQPDGTWALNLDRYKTRLLAIIDIERGKRVTYDARKSYAHTRKGVEAERILLMSDELTALSEDDLARRFPWLAAEAGIRGEPITDTAARVRDAMLESEATSARNEARAVAAKEAVRLAASRDEADAAARVEWI